MKKETKQEIHDLVMDHLITQQDVQQDLFGEPIVIVVKGAPIDVIIFHEMYESIVCYSKKTIFGLNRPTSNKWNAIKMLSKWLFKGTLPKKHTTTWFDVFKSFRTP